MAAVSTTIPATKGNVRGRRKLDFREAQRFKGKTFFLDLTGYRRSKDLAQELIRRGATVESFFDSKVRYLITNKSPELIKQTKSNVQISSNKSPKTPSTGGLSQLISPCSTGSAEKKSTTMPYYTRAQKMMQMSLGKDQGKSDVLTMANSWNCKILHVDAVEKELKKLKPVPGKPEEPKKIANKDTVRKLRKPFFKCEDSLRKYRPIIFETSKWPQVDPACSSRASPFDNYKLEIEANEEEKEDNIDQEEASTDEDKRSGYCEPCITRYDNLKMHLRSSKHQQYANNDSNFSKLDELISLCTPVAEFLAELKQQVLSEVKTDVLQTPPRRSPRIKQPYLSLTKVQSPLTPVAITRRVKRRKLETSSSELRTTKKARLSL